MFVGDTIVDFYAALFPPGSWCNFRPIESWDDGQKRKNRVVYKRCESLTHGSRTPDGWAVNRDEIREALGRQIEAAAAEKANLYFSVCQRPYRNTPKKSFDHAFQIRDVHHLWCDLDKIDAAAALARVRAAKLPEPSAVIGSGNGVHLYWLLDEPYKIDDAGDVRAVEIHWEGSEHKRRKIEGFRVDGELVFLSKTNERKILPPLSAKALAAQETIAGIAAAIGGDHTHDLARILRWPGSTNYKNARNGAEPRPCEILDLDTTRRYSFDDFAGFAKESPQRLLRTKIEGIPLPEKKAKVSGRHSSRLRELITACHLAEPGERSERDFEFCCVCHELGVATDTAWAMVADKGKFAERGEGYFHSTWEAAQQHAKARIYDRIRAKSVPGIRGVGEYSGFGGAGVGVVVETDDEADDESFDGSGAALNSIDSSADSCAGSAAATHRGGGGRADQPSGAASPLTSRPRGASGSQAPRRGTVRNALKESVGEGTETTPYGVADIAKQIREFVSPHLKSVSLGGGNAMLFEHELGDEQSDIRYFGRPDTLFGWIGDIGGRPAVWERDPGCLTKAEFYSRLPLHVPTYKWIESAPQWPAIPGVYYACQAPEPRPTGRLDDLIDCFAYDDEIAREIAKAAFLTAFLGVHGAKPMLYVHSIDGQGAGKTQFAETVAYLTGRKPLKFDGAFPTEKERAENFTDSDSYQSRVVLFDNIRSLKSVSNSGLESLLTSEDIKGRVLYVGPASRKNNLAYFLTSNYLAMNRDLAQRTVMVEIRRSPHREDVGRKARDYIDAHRVEILQDISAFFARPIHPMEINIRWGFWAREIVARLDQPIAVLERVCQHQGEMDGSEEDKDIVIDAIASALGYEDAAKAHVHVSSETLAATLTDLTGFPVDTGKAISAKLNEILIASRTAKNSFEILSGWLHYAVKRVPQSNGERKQVRGWFYAGKDSVADVTGTV